MILTDVLLELKSSIPPRGLNYEAVPRNWGAASLSCATAVMLTGALLQDRTAVFNGREG